MPDSPSPVIVSVSCPDQATARQIATSLIEVRLIACAQVFPIHSIYRWEGAVQSEPEVMLQAKTLHEHLPELEKVVMDLHPYDVPEILATPVIWGHQPYVKWVGEETGKKNLH